MDGTIHREGITKYYEKKFILNVSWIRTPAKL